MRTGALNSSWWSALLKMIGSELTEVEKETFAQAPKEWKKLMHVGIRKTHGEEKGEREDKLEEKKGKLVLQAFTIGPCLRFALITEYIIQYILELSSQCFFF